MRERDGRLQYIDGLRALAVLSVVWFHIGVHNEQLRHLTGAAGVLLRAGAHGVDLFFVLSGFCLAYPTLIRLRTEGRASFNVAGFAARRIVRILPPYYAAIAMLFVIGTLLNFEHMRLPQSMDPRALSATGVFTQMFFLDDKYLSGSFWTLAIEFRWYFAFPALLWLWTRSRAAFLAIVALLLAVPGGGVRSIDLFCLPAFMLGIVAADIFVVRPPIARFAAMALPGLLFAAFISTANYGWSWVGAGPYWAIAMFCLVVAAGDSHGLRSALSGRAITLVGFTSYGIYLAHEPAVELFQHAVPAHLPVVVPAIAAFAGATLAGIAFSFVAERPFVTSALRDTMIRKLDWLFTAAARRCGLTTGFRVGSLPVPEVRAIDEAVA
jgi:peptidoglycan/LPS O-acetylase OafA/YrhL